MTRRRSSAAAAPADLYSQASSGNPGIPFDPPAFIRQPQWESVRQLKLAQQVRVRTNFQNLVGLRSLVVQQQAGTRANVHSPTKTNGLELFMCDGNEQSPGAHRDEDHGSRATAHSLALDRRCKTSQRADAPKQGNETPCGYQWR